jgi:hypothetical protein
MGIELRKTKVDDGSRLERVEHFIPSHCPGPKSFEQFDGFSRCHGRQSATVWSLGHVESGSTQRSKEVLKSWSHGTRQTPLLHHPITSLLRWVDRETPEATSV